MLNPQSSNLSSDQHRRGTVAAIGNQDLVGTDAFDYYQASPM